MSSGLPLSPRYFSACEEMSEVFLSLGFPLFEHDPRVLPEFLHFTPCQFLYVAFTQPGQTREEERTFQYRVAARSRCQFLYLVQRQVIAFDFFLLESFDSAQRVYRYDLVVVCLIDASTQLVEVGYLGVLRQPLECVAFTAGSDTLVRIFLHVVQKLFESRDKFRCYFPEGGFLVAIDFKVAEAASPVAPVALRFRILTPFLHHLAIVFQKGRVLLELAREGIFAVLYFDQTFGLDGLCCSQRLTVLFAFQRSFGIYQVELQILLVASAVSTDVKIQAYVAVRQLLFPKPDGFFLGSGRFSHSLLSPFNNYTKNSFIAVSRSRGTVFCPRTLFGGRTGDKNTIKMRKQTRQSKKKRK